MNRSLLLAALAALFLLVGCGGSRPYAPAAFTGAGPTPTPAPTAPPGVVDTYPDFSVTVERGESFVTPVLGADGTLTVALTVRTNAALTAPVALSLKNPPAGASATFSPTSVSPSSSPVAVTLTLKVADPSKSDSLLIVGKSGSVERTTSLFYTGYVAPSGFSIALAPVAGQSSGSRTQLFDVTLSQTAGSGAFSLSVDRNDLSGDGALIPNALPSGATVTGLPDSVTLSGASQTFLLTVTLPVDATSFFYGFGAKATRGGRTESAATQFFYAGAASSPVTVSQQASVSGVVDTVKLTYTPKSDTFSGTIVVDRLPDGDLGSQGGKPLLTLPAGSVVSGLPQTLTFDGTGSPRTATFTVTAPAGTTSANYYGIRAGATSPGSDVTLESVVLLQFGIGGG